MVQDVQEFNRVLQCKLEPLMKVCGLHVHHFDGELLELSDRVYPRVHVQRAQFQNSSAER